MGLSPWLLRAIKRKGFRLPTPIQRRTLPLILQVCACFDVPCPGCPWRRAAVL